MYLAEMMTDNNFSRVVAIKLLHAKWVDHDEIVQRSRDEARVLGLLQHRNIINVVSLTSIAGKCAIVMEYVDGVTLDEHINKISGPINEEELVPMFCELLEAFEYAHKNKIVHRDIKPSNIIVNKEGNVKVLDFGIAKIKCQNDKILFLTLVIQIKSQKNLSFLSSAG